MVIAADPPVHLVMRALAVLFTLLLVLAPAGLAQSGPGSGAPTSSSPPACREADCDEEDDSHEGDDSNVDNRTRPGNGTRPAEHGDDMHDEGDEPFGPGCRNGNRTAEELQRCRRAVAGIERERGRTWIGFQADAPNATLRDYTIGGLPALESLTLDLDGANLTLRQAGSTLFVRDGESELRLHDEPNGLIRFKGAAGNITLVFPANATIDHGEHGARIAYAGGREGHLLADNATWLANGTVQLNGFFAFHVPPAHARAAPEEPAPATEAKEGVQRAIERRSIGAEVTLRAADEVPANAASSAAAQDASGPIEILAYDDVEVEVELPDAAASPEAPVRVVVSSELDEGRTIVLNVDATLLDSTDPDHLVLRYFDLHNQTDGSILETEVLFVQADSLQDVLSPDEAQPEYWVVEDANGLQVLVSVPHWSAHAITVASFFEGVDAPSVVVGISVGAGMTVALGLVMLWPRRRPDEF